MTLHLAAPGPSDGWLALVRADSALLVHPGAIAPSDLYAALGGPDPVRGTIELLSSRGFASTPDFGLVARSSSGPLHVVVRGAVEVVLGDVTVSGAEVSTWTERVVAADAEYEIRAPEAASATSSAQALPLVDGAVWATSLGTSGHGDERPAGDGEATPTFAAPEPIVEPAPGGTDAPDPATPEPESEQTPVPDPEPTPEPELTPEAEPEVEPSPDERATVIEPPFSEDTVLPAEDASDRNPADSSGEPDHPEDSEQPEHSDQPAQPDQPEQPEQPDESTIVRPVDAEPPTVPFASAAPVPEADAGDHDGMTVMSSDVQGLLQRERPTEDEIAHPDAALAYEVVLPDGTREPLDGEMLIGRSPSGRVTGGTTPRLVTLSGDPDISRTHVRITLEGDTVVVTDMHSRNGTTLQVVGKSPQLLRAGEPAAVIPGTVVDLGGGTVLRIEEAG